MHFIILIVQSYPSRGLDVPSPLTHSALRMLRVLLVDGPLPPWFCFSRSLCSFAIPWRAALLVRKCCLELSQKAFPGLCCTSGKHDHSVPYAASVPQIPLLLSGFISLFPHLYLQCWTQGLAHDRCRITHCERMNGEWINEWLLSSRSSGWQGVAKSGKLLGGSPGQAYWRPKLNFFWGQAFWEDPFLWTNRSSFPHITGPNFLADCLAKQCLSL